MFVAQRDASDTCHNQQLAEWLHNHLPAVQTYAHTAGVLGFDLIPDLIAEQFARVVKPKANAAAEDSSCQCRARLYRQTVAYWQIETPLSRLSQ